MVESTFEKADTNKIEGIRFGTLVWVQKSWANGNLPYGKFLCSIYPFVWYTILLDQDKNIHTWVCPWLCLTTIQHKNIQHIQQYKEVKKNKKKWARACESCQIMMQNYSLLFFFLRTNMVRGSTTITLATYDVLEILNVIYTSFWSL